MDRKGKFCVIRKPNELPYEAEIVQDADAMGTLVVRGVRNGPTRMFHVPDSYVHAVRDTRTEAQEVADDGQRVYRDAMALVAYAERALAAAVAVREEMVGLVMARNSPPVTAQPEEVE